LQNGDKSGASKQFLVWNKITVDGKKQVCKGLVNRRAREQALFNQSYA
jgi:lysozyme